MILATSSDPCQGQERGSQEGLWIWDGAAIRKGRRFSCICSGIIDKWKEAGPTSSHWASKIKIQRSVRVSCLYSNIWIQSVLIPLFPSFPKQMAKLCLKKPRCCRHWVVIVRWGSLTLAWVQPQGLSSFPLEVLSLLGLKVALIMRWIKPV